MGVSVLIGLELHEHEVPDLDEAILAAVLRAAPLAELGAHVAEDLRGGTVRAGVGHAPPVVLVEPLDPVGRNPDHLAPDVGRLVVAEVHGDPELGRIEAEHLGHQLPGHGDRLVLEVVTEAEVAHHLEEGEMPGCPANLVEVVVLAPGPTHFWTVTARGWSGFSSPTKYGLNGTMPELTNSSVWSCGIRLADGMS